MKKSNLTIKSNIYPVNVNDENKIAFSENEKFNSRIYDRDALRQLVKIIDPTVINDELRIKVAKNLVGISKEQAELIGMPYTCSLASKDEEPWGISVAGGKITFECRCRKTSCRFHAECMKNNE